MPVIQRQKITIKKPARLICFSFLLVIIVGALLLMLPFASKDGQSTPFGEAFFTATSATCVTGLIIHDIFQKWTLFGQIVILGMIQLGGLGLVTLVAFFNFILGKKMGLRNMQVATDSLSSGNFNQASSLIKSVMKVAITFELLGAAILMGVFIPRHGTHGIFMSIFISISSFCNAGFDIMGKTDAFVSLTEYYNNPIVLFTVMILIISGGLGFVVWYDILQFIKTKKLMLHTKIVLAASLFLIIFGSVIITSLEWNNPTTLGDMNAFDKIVNGLFLSVSARTAGFNTFDVNSMGWLTKIVLSLLMFVGASPGSTGGGIKTTTIVVILATVLSVLKNKSETIIFGRKIDKSVVYRSVAILTMSLCLIGFISIGLYHSSSYSVEFSLINAIFESFAAFTTTGLSSGITAVANGFGRFLLIIAMFFGRIGPVAVILSLSFTNETSNKKQVFPEGKVNVG